MISWQSILNVVGENRRRSLMIGFVGIFIVAANAWAIFATPYRWATGQVRIGVADSAGCGAVFIAKERGFFKDITVDVRHVKDSDYAFSMLIGDIDGFCGSLEGFIRTVRGDLKGRIVYLFNESVSPIGLIAKPQIDSLSDLRGKRIAAQTGSPWHFLLLHSLQGAGVDPNEHTHINLTPDDAGEAFMKERGDLSAVITVEPWLTTIHEARMGRMLLSVPMLGDNLTLGTELIERQPKVIRALINGLSEGNDFIKANPVAATEIVARNLKIDATRVSRINSGIRYLDRTQNQIYLRSQGQAEQVLALLDRAAGVAATSRNWSNSVTDDFVK